MSAEPSRSHRPMRRAAAAHKFVTTQKSTALISDGPSTSGASNLEISEETIAHAKDALVVAEENETGVHLEEEYIVEDQPPDVGGEEEFIDDENDDNDEDIDDIVEVDGMRKHEIYLNDDETRPPLIAHEDLPRKENGRVIRPRKRKRLSAHDVGDGIDYYATKYYHRYKKQDYVRRNDGAKYCTVCLKKTFGKFRPLPVDLRIRKMWILRLNLSVERSAELWLKDSFSQGQHPGELCTLHFPPGLDASRPSHEVLPMDMRDTDTELLELDPNFDFDYIELECIFCQKRNQLRTMLPFIRTRSRRYKWVNALAGESDETRDKMITQLRGPEPSFLCDHHFRDEHFDINAFGEWRLKKNALPDPLALESDKEADRTYMVNRVERYLIRHEESRRRREQSLYIKHDQELRQAMEGDCRGLRNYPRVPRCGGVPFVYNAPMPYEPRFGMEQWRRSDGTSYVVYSDGQMYIEEESAPQGATLIAKSTNRLSHFSSSAVKPEAEEVYSESEGVIEDGPGIRNLRNRRIPLRYDRKEFKEEPEDAPSSQHMESTTEGPEICADEIVVAGDVTDNVVEEEVQVDGVIDPDMPSTSTAVIGVNVVDSTSAIVGNATVDEVQEGHEMIDTHRAESRAEEDVVVDIYNEDDVPVQKVPSILYGYDTVEYSDDSDEENEAIREVNEAELPLGGARFCQVCNRVVSSQRSLQEYRPRTWPFDDMKHEKYLEIMAWPQEFDDSMRILWVKRRHEHNLGRGYHGCPINVCESHLRFRDLHRRVNDWLSTYCVLCDVDLRDKNLLLPFPVSKADRIAFCEQLFNGPSPPATKLIERRWQYLFARLTRDKPTRYHMCVYHFQRESFIETEDCVEFLDNASPLPMCLSEFDVVARGPNGVVKCPLCEIWNSLDAMMEMRPPENLSEKIFFAEVLVGDKALLRKGLEYISRNRNSRVCKAHFLGVEASASTSRDGFWAVLAERLLVRKVPVMCAQCGTTDYASNMVPVPSDGTTKQMWIDTSCRQPWTNTRLSRRLAQPGRHYFCAAHFHRNAMRFIPGLGIYKKFVYLPVTAVAVAKHHFAIDEPYQPLLIEGWDNVGNSVVKEELFYDEVKEFLGPDAIIDPNELLRYPHAQQPGQSDAQLNAQLQNERLATMGVSGPKRRGRRGQPHAHGIEDDEDDGPHVLQPEEKIYVVMDENGQYHRVEGITEDNEALYVELRPDIELGEGMEVMEEDELGMPMIMPEESIAVQEVSQEEEVESEPTNGDATATAEHDGVVVEEQLDMPTTSDGQDEQQCLDPVA